MKSRRAPYALAARRNKRRGYPPPMGASWSTASGPELEKRTKAAETYLDVVLAVDTDLRARACKAMKELPGLYMTIGQLGPHFRRCKPGSKRFKEIDEAYTRLCSIASELSFAVQLVLNPIPPFHEKS